MTDSVTASTSFGSQKSLQRQPGFDVEAEAALNSAAGGAMLRPESAQRRTPRVTPKLTVHHVGFAFKMRLFSDHFSSQDKFVFFLRLIRNLQSLPMKSPNSLLSIHTTSLPNNSRLESTPLRRESVEGPIPVEVFRGNALEKVSLP